MDWSLSRDNATFLLCRLPLMAVDRIDAAHDRAFCRGLDPDHFAGAAFVTPCQNDDPVAFLDFRRHHKTSGASDMIFIWFLARSSRGTGPKMRVPTGSA